MWCSECGVANVVLGEDSCVVCLASFFRVENVLCGKRYVIRMYDDVVMDNMLMDVCLRMWCSECGVANVVLRLICSGWYEWIEI